MKANQIVVTVHFAQPIPSPPPTYHSSSSSYSSSCLSTEKRTCMQGNSGTYCPFRVNATAKFRDSELLLFGPLRTCCWVIHQRLISTHKKSSHSCTEDNEHSSACQVRCSSVLLLISFMSGGAPDLVTIFWSRRRASWGEKKAISEEKRPLLFCWIATGTRWWKKLLFNFTH